MNPPSTIRDLTEADWNRLQDLADRFEDGWSAEVSLGTFLPPNGDALRPLALQELIKADLEIRWRAKQPKMLEQYLHEFPELGEISALPPEVVYEEYRARQLHGDKPDLKTYSGRFPEQFKALQELLKKSPLPSPAQPTPGQELFRDTRANPEATVIRPVAPVTRVAVAVPSEGEEEVGEGYRKTTKKIGGGGFGEVWVGIAPGGIKVALKVLFRPMEDEEAR